MDYHIVEWERLKREILPRCSLLAGGWAGQGQRQRCVRARPCAGGWGRVVEGGARGGCGSAHRGGQLGAAAGGEGRATGGAGGSTVWQHGLMWVGQWRPGGVVSQSAPLSGSVRTRLALRVAFLPELPRALPCCSNPLPWHATPHATPQASPSSPRT